MPRHDHKTATARPNKDKARAPQARPKSQGPAVETDHEGALENRVGDRTGPGAGYDREPEQVRNKSGVES
jgi:hypothetical protein